MDRIYNLQFIQKNYERGSVDYLQKYGALEALFKSKEKSVYSSDCCSGKAFNKKGTASQVYGS